MARRKLNSKKRFKIFKKILLEENKRYWHNVALLEKLWKKIPQCNTNALNADEVFSIIEKEKVKANVYSICKFFKITLNKTNGKKFVIFNKNNNLIINYRNENDIFYFLGHIFHNFLDGAYFKYPFKKHTWDLEYRRKLAENFANNLNTLIARYKLTCSFKKHFEIIDNFNFEIIDNFNFEIIDNFEEKIDNVNFEIIDSFEEKDLTEDDQYLSINKIQNENEESKITYGFSKAA